MAEFNPQLHAFRDQLKRMAFIDGVMLPELTPYQQTCFMDDPVKYFVRANDEHAAAIWREMQRTHL
jgi:hypothetical protein